MSQKRTNLEVIAPTVEEAISRGLQDLGLPEEAVDIEVLDEGKSGLFGLGTRQARVRLSIKIVPVEKPEPSDRPDVHPGRRTAAQVQVDDAGRAESASELDSRMGTQARPELEQEAEFPETGEAEGLEEEDQALSVARRVVSELVGRMHIHAEVSAEYGEPDDPSSRRPLIVNIEGDDLSILIGPRAETLNALQYIAVLIIGKELGRSVPLVVDVQGYRQRRTREVRLLARRMAEQAVLTGRRQYLEPMPANERRLVHIELRDHPDVTTESVGEDPRRKVTVVPKL